MQMNGPLRHYYPYRDLRKLPIEKFEEVTTRMVVDYNKLKSIRLIRPTIHKYLSGYTISQFRRIDADEWTIATLLPVQRFKKASASEVWKESRGMI